MAASRLKAYGVAAGFAVVTASGIVGVAAVALGVSISPCGAGGGGCAPEQSAAVVAAVPAADSAVEAAVPAEPATAELPRHGPQAIDAAAAAVMAEQIEMASISVAPALPAAPAGTASQPAATAAAPKLAPLPVPEPLAAMGVQDEDAGQVVASELSVVPSDAARSAPDALTVEAGPPAPGVAAATGLDSGAVETAPAAAVELAVAPRPSAAPDREAAQEPEPEPELGPQAAAAVRTVAGAGVNVRSGPSNDSGKLFALTGGTTVEVTGEERGWLNVVDAEGRSGWAYSEFFD